VIESPPARLAVSVASTPVLRWDAQDDL